MLVVLATSPVARSHGPEHGEDQQHGSPGGHLAASSHDVELVGKVALTSVDGGISDVAVFDGYAYLGAFRPECGTSGGGVHVVDVRDPTAPVKVAFIPSHPNVYVGEGVHVMRMRSPEFTGDILIHNNEACSTAQPYLGGISLWDVTDPTNPQPLALGVGDFVRPDGSIKPVASQSHSAMGWTVNRKAYVVMTDNEESKDVDILDITDPRNPVLISESGIEDWPGAHGSFANGDSIFHHDMWVKKIKNHWYVLVSYWDAGFVLLNVDDPANPVFVKDSDYPVPDPLTGFALPEGNGHQATWSSDSKFIIATDEDFSPYRTRFEMTSGPHAGEYGAGQFGWTVPIPPEGFTGTTVFGGSGCVEDLNGNGVSDRDEVPSAASTGANTVVFSRGACFFSTKVESGQMAGYDMVIIGNSHGGTRNGLTPDAFVCGSAGHVFTPTAHAVCIGHRAMHLLFEDAPAYTGPEGYTAGGDLPAIGTLGASFTASTVFDGWGYVHLLDAETFDEIDAYAVPEALDPAFAAGYGALTVHEVKTDPRDEVNLAYLSYYDAGFRVVSFGRDGMQEVGHFVAEGGNDFWGVYPVEQDDGSVLVFLSDRDSGLWIFRYTGG